MMNTRIALLIIASSMAFNSVDVIAFMSPQSTSMHHHPSSLNMNNNHRARAEKNFEDMMGNDWRMFRAQLVAQETADRQIQTGQKHHSHGNSSRKSMAGFGEHSMEAMQDDKQVKQEKFGNIFAAIFSNNVQREETHLAQKSIFDGQNVGGATPDSMIPDCEDPFVSKAEIPVLLKPKVRIDKHRWAHPLSHIEPGCVLVANEKLGGVFHQTVVLIIEHNEGTGSTGIVINRPLAGNLLKIASETESNVDLSLKLAFNSAAVTYGGPVLQEDYSVLHGYGNVEGSKKVAPGVFVGGSEELMKEVRKRNLHASDVLFVKGHAAWVPNQLAREISKGVWYTASCSSDFLLRYAGAPVSDDDNKVDLWSDILTSMGEEYASIAVNHRGKGDMRMMP